MAAMRLPVAAAMTAWMIGLGACGAAWVTRDPNAGALAHPTPQAPALPPGTPVLLSLTSLVHTGDGSTADASFVVLHEVRTHDGTVALRAGTPALVRLHERPAGRLGRPGMVRLEAIGALASDGSIVPLTGGTEVSGVGRQGLAAGLTVGMFFVYAPWNFLHLLHRGHEATLASGLMLQAYVTAAGPPIDERVRRP